MCCRLLSCHTEAEQFSKQNLGRPGRSMKSERGLIEGAVGMNLYTWLPAMFVLGIVMMGLCLLFVEACDKM
jgi:type IV secretory pathway TrbD component